jgi:hypothetical protein
MYNGAQIRDGSVLPESAAMWRRRPGCAMLLSVAVIGFFVLWWSFSPGMEEHYEQLLVGKDLQQVKSILADATSERFYHTRADWEKVVGGPVGWPEGVMAIGHWEVEPEPGPIVNVHFDGAGKVIRVRYQTFVSGDSFSRMLRRLR